MWILPKQLHTSAYVLDMKELGLDSETFSQICERSLTWRGKDSLSRTWSQRLKRESWMRHLSSRTLNNSHTESFVDKWTSSLEDSRASHSQLLENVKPLTIPDTCSHTSETESGTANLELFSSKTLRESSQPKPATENPFSNMSSQSWKAWVTEQRQEYSQRVKSAHLIRESESSSLGWPTARTSDAEGGRIETEMTSGGFKSKRHKSNQTFGAKLRDAVETHEEKKNWATPNTMDHMDQRSPEALQRQFETTRKGRTAPANLREQVHPQNWPTASTRDHKGGYTGGRIRNGKVSMDTLDVAVQAHTEGGLLDQASDSTSGKSQGLQGKLNPNWVEHLMGLPVGWTDLGSWATE